MLLRVTNRAGNFVRKNVLAGYRRFVCALLLAFAALPAISAQDPVQAPPPNSSSPPVARPAQPSGGAFSSTSPPQTSPRAGLNIVVLDPAHGGTDTGARGTGGVRESEIVLEFAVKVR